MKKFQWMHPRQHLDTHAFRRYELAESSREIIRPLPFKCGWFTIADLQEGELRAARCGACVRAARWHRLKEGVLDCLRTVRWALWWHWSRP